MSETRFLVSDNPEGSQAKILEVSSEANAIQWAKDAANKSGHTYTLFRLVATVHPGERRDAVVVGADES